MSEIMESCSLMYILEDGKTEISVSNKEKYKTKILDTFALWSTLKNKIKDGSWENAVPPGGAFFDCVIALDVIHNDLTADELKAAEDCFASVANIFYKSKMSWTSNKWGAYGVWAVYQNNTKGINEACSKYKGEMLGYLTPDGVSTTGPGYAKARYSGDREAKQYFMDVLTYTGIYNFYTDPEFRSFYEWLYGHATTAFKRLWVFGDSYYESSIECYSSINKAGNFSDKAGKSAVPIPIANMP
jgi:hypothetical protein